MIYVFDENPHLSVAEVADIDLEPMINKTFNVLDEVTLLKQSETLNYHQMGEWTKWASSTKENFDWLIQYCVILDLEKRMRFGGLIHDKALGAIMLPPLALPETGLTPKPVALEQCRLDYVRRGHLSWTNRTKPAWY